MIGSRFNRATSATAGAVAAGNTKRIARRAKNITVGRA
jgi:hypothetical protein